MYAQTLQEIGLTPNEAKIYETLLNDGELGVSSISLNAGVHRRNVYDALDRLSEKGLVFPILSKGENIYKAANPTKLLEIVRAQENKLLAILPALEEKYSQGPQKQETFIYRGIEGVKNYLRDILKTGADLYTIGSAGFLFNEKIKAFMPGFRTEEQSLGIKEKHIFNSALRGQVAGWANLPGVEYKFLPAGSANEMSINIFGDHVVSVVKGESDDELTLYVSIDAKLAAGYRQMFEVMWNSITE